MDSPISRLHSILNMHTSLSRILVIVSVVLAVTLDAAVIRRTVGSSSLGNTTTNTTSESLRNASMLTTHHTNSSTSSTNITKTCHLNCSNSTGPVCGSDGLTYINKCSLQVKNCLENRLITVKSIGACPFNCTHEQIKSRITPPIRIMHKRVMLLTSKCPSRSLTIQQLIEPFPYVPTCSSEDPALYAPVQHINGRWCLGGVYWCTTPDGVAIESTVSWERQPDCSGRKGCLHNGVRYNDGEILKSSCGVCECLNGTIECIKNYCNTTEGLLSETQLGSLKSDILHLFHFQYQHKEHILIDLRHIRNSQLNFHKQYLKRIIDWKFDRYNANGNDAGLQYSEVHRFIGEIVSLIGTKPQYLSSQLQGCMDENQDGHVSRAEWDSYFLTSGRVCEAGSGTSGETSRTSRTTRSARHLRDSTARD